MPHLTEKAQDLIIYILSKEVITFRTQRVFKSRKFYNVISFLRRNNYINAVCVSCSRKIDATSNTCGKQKCDRKKTTNLRAYELTLKGEIVAHELRSLKA